MSSSTVSPRNPFTLPQIITGVLIVSAIIVFFGLTRNAAKLESISAEAATIESELGYEQTRSIALQATVVYTQSDAAIQDHLVHEDKQLKEGEVPVSVNMVTQVPEVVAQPTATPDPAIYAQRWQFWWQLLTDAPPPASE